MGPVDDAYDRTPEPPRSRRARLRDVIVTALLVALLVAALMLFSPSR